jgi:predicted nucleotidyltransferase
MHPVEPYIEAWRARLRRSAEEDARHAAQARALLPTIVGCLAERFGATRVVLVGSLARGDFRRGSDIDLWVEGVATERFFEASAEVSRLAHPLQVDLAPWDRIRPEVARIALQDAEVLHGA